MIQAFFAKLAIPYFAASSCAHSFFFFPTWYKYLDDAGKLDANCNITANGFQPVDIWLIGLAVLDLLLRLAGFVAVVSIIIAGIQYITATGSPEKTTAARRRLTNSLIGLAIALIAIATVSFIGAQLGA